MNQVAQRILELRQRESDARQQVEQDLSEQIQGLKHARSELEEKIQKYQEKCASLQRSVRRSTNSVEAAGAYRGFVGMQLKMATAMTQALKQTGTGDRLLDLTSAFQEQERTHLQALLEAKSELEEKAQHYLSLLQDSPRGDFPTDPYRTFVSIHSRMAGAISQAMKRASSGDRFLEVAKSAAEERREQEARERAEIHSREAIREVQQLQLPRDDDFETLYGDGTEEGDF